MATRDDISVRWDLSPRIITVAAPSTEVTIQDLHDTLRDLEDEPANMIYPSIISSAGKEELGGGVLVGLTATLLDAKLQFEGRPTPFIVEESATAGSVSETLIDSLATFESDGVLIGDIIYNITQNAYGEVANVISETELQTTVLSNSASWNNGDQYNIWHVIQCNVLGGNLVAEDSLGSALDPIFPSSFTQVVRTSSSSATLQELDAIQYSSYGGAVHIDATSSFSGTTYPVGTPQQPVNNIEDAIIIAEERGFEELQFDTSYTFDSGDDVSQYDLVGNTETKVVLTFSPGSICVGTEIENCTIQGTLVSPSAFKKCIVEQIELSHGVSVDNVEISNCVLNNTISLSLAFEGQINILNCVSGSNSPVLNINGSNTNCIFRNYSGDIEIQGLSSISSNTLSIDMNSGNVTIDSSCTTGSIVVRGISLLSDNSNGTTVLTSGLVFPDSIQLSSFSSFIYIDTSSGTTGTKYPNGTASYPVNNLADAKAISLQRNITNILVKGTLIIGPADNIDNFLFKGITAATSVIVLTSGCSTDGTQFEDLTLSGVVDGDIIVRRCGIVNLTNIGDGTLGTTFASCALLDNISPCIKLRNDISHGTTKLFMIDCASFSNTEPGPVLDFNDSDVGFIASNYNGDGLVKNVTQGNIGHVIVQGGSWSFDTTCIDGTFDMDGIGKITDLGVGTGFDINIDGLISSDIVADSVWDENMSDHENAGSTGAGLKRIDSNTKLIPGTL